MPLSFKLVGYIGIYNNYEIINSFKGTINLLDIYKLFISYGLSSDEVEQIIFIINSEQIKDKEKIYTINENETYKIFMFIFDKEIKQKLQLIIKTFGIEYNEKIKILTQIKNNKFINKLTFEIINKQNDKTLLLLSDPDFIILLNIYNKKPYLFNILSNYIQDNEFYNIDNKEININTLSFEEKLYYEQLSLKIINLNLGFSQENIMNNLIKYSGHLNLTIRSLLI